MADHVPPRYPEHDSQKSTARTHDVPWCVECDMPARSCEAPGHTRVESSLPPYIRVGVTWTWTCDRCDEGLLAGIGGTEASAIADASKHICVEYMPWEDPTE